jgi:hypothetical protein
VGRGVCGAPGEYAECGAVLVAGGVDEAPALLAFAFLPVGEFVFEGGDAAAGVPVCEEVEEGYQDGGGCGGFGHGRASPRDRCVLSGSGVERVRLMTVGV